jgi:hypothetical protein
MRGVEIAPVQYGVLQRSIGAIYIPFVPRGVC